MRSSLSLAYLGAHRQCEKGPRRRPLPVYASCVVRSGGAIIGAERASNGNQNDTQECSSTLSTDSSGNVSSKWMCEGGCPPRPEQEVPLSFYQDRGGVLGRSQLLDSDLSIDLQSAPRRSTPKQ